MKVLRPLFHLVALQILKDGLLPFVLQRDQELGLRGEVFERCQCPLETTQQQVERASGRSREQAAVAQRGVERLEVAPCGGQRKVARRSIGRRQGFLPDRGFDLISRERSPVIGQRKIGQLLHLREPRVTQREGLMGWMLHVERGPWNHTFDVVNQLSRADDPVVIGVRITSQSAQQKVGECSVTAAPVHTLPGNLGLLTGHHAEDFAGNGRNRAPHRSIYISLRGFDRAQLGRMANVNIDQHAPDSTQTLAQQVLQFVHGQTRAVKFLRIALRGNDGGILRLIIGNPMRRQYQHKCSVGLLGTAQIVL